MPRERFTSGEPQAELPIPTEGLFNQIASELLVDRAKFTARALTNMQKENEDLRENLIHITLVTPSRELALDWALMYYELNARPGRAGKSIPIVRVSKDTIDAMTSIQARTFEPLISQMEEIDNHDSLEAIEVIREELRQAMDGIDSMDEEFRNEDSKRSPEFSMFWSSFFLLRVRMAMEDPERAELRHHFEPLNLIVRSLHEQAERNQFRSKFSNLKE